MRSGSRVSELDDNDLEASSSDFKGNAPAVQSYSSGLAQKFARGVSEYQDFDRYLCLDDSGNKITISKIGRLQEGVVDSQFIRKNLVAKINAMKVLVRAKNRAIISVTIDNCDDPEGRVLQSIASSDIAGDIGEIVISNCVINRIGAKINRGKELLVLGDPLRFDNLTSINIATCGGLKIINLHAPLLEKKSINIDEDSKSQLILSQVKVRAQIDQLEMNQIFTPNKTGFALRVANTPDQRLLKEAKKIKLGNVKGEILAKRVNFSNYQSTLKEISVLLDDITGNKEDSAKSVDGIVAVDPSIKIVSISGNIQVVRGFFDRRSQSTRSDLDEILCEDSIKNIFDLGFKLISYVEDDLEKQSFMLYKLSDDNQNIVGLVEKMVKIASSLHSIRSKPSQDFISELEMIFIKMNDYQKLEAVKLSSNQDFVQALHQIHDKLSNFLEDVPLDSPRRSFVAPSNCPTSPTSPSKDSKKKNI